VNNLFLKRMMGMGPGFWAKVSDSPLVVSGSFVATGSPQIRFDGGAGVQLPNNLPLSFERVDLARVEFSGDISATLSIFAGAWS
jgi:hypothetical protein